MSMICRVLIGYFDAEGVRTQRGIVPIRPLDENQVAHLQAACDDLFGIKLRLSEHLTRDGLLWIEDAVVRRDTYKAAAVAYGIFGMSAVDNAHWCVIFPAMDIPLPEREQLLQHYKSFRPDMDDQQRRQQADKDLQWMGEERQFKRDVQERVRLFATAWRGRTGLSTG